MKKILFLLLCTVSMYGQVSNGGEQEFDYGIKNNAAQTVTSSVNLVTQGTDGTFGKIALNINTKSFLSTGLIKNGMISINADPTKFNITAGIGIISNFDDPQNPTSTLVNFPAFTGITPTYLLTGNITYIAINSTPAVVMQATPFTPEQRRSLIILGAAIHSNLTNINVVNNISAPSNASTNQLHDFIEAVGALNLTGNKYTANGVNLQLNKSAGTIFKMGVNFANDWKNPHSLAQTAGTSLTFRYRTQNGTEGSDRINLDPALYDLNNILTSVPNNKFTIQTVVMFQTGLTRILYGQNVYDDLASAKAAVFTRNFVIEPNSLENGIIRGYIIMKNTTTSLQNTSDSDILEAQKFGGVASGGVALTFANIVTALGFTPENVDNKQNSLTIDGTGVKYPTVDAVNAGLALKADNTQAANYANLKKNITHTFVSEIKPRNNIASYTYSGSILTVGAGGTYATISAALAASVSGDILQLADGTYNTASETGGILQISLGSKQIMIRGNASNNGSVIIQQSAAASFCVLVQATLGLTVKDLTITTNQSNTALNLRMDSGISNTVFDNCVIRNTSSSSNIVNTVAITGTPAFSGLYNFTNCDIYENNNISSYALFQLEISDAQATSYLMPITLSKCNIYGKIDFKGASKFYMYDSNIVSASNFTILGMGRDTSAPVNFTSIIDVRSCYFSFASGFTQHGVLFGRGSKNIYFVNNNVSISSSVNSLSLGLVIKSIATNIGDVIIAGNYVEAPRPIYIKGGQNNYLSNNTSFSNWGDATNGYGFEINNPLNLDGEIDSLGNIVEFNDFVANKDAIGLSYAGTTTAIVSFKKCFFRNNHYYIPSGKLYINDPSTTWETRNTHRQDFNSILNYY